MKISKFALVRQISHLSQVARRVGDLQPGPGSKPIDFSTERQRLGGFEGVSAGRGRPVLHSWPQSKINLITKKFKNY
jgi:hypothetical protein